MSIDSADPIDQLLTLLENSRVKAFFEKLIDTAVEKKIKDYCETPDFKNSVETVMLDSEIKPVKRISTIETVLGINGTIDYEDEERELSVLEKIDSIEGKLENFECRPTVSPLEPMTIIPETKTEARAVFLVEYLENEVKERNGELFLNGNEIKDFFTRIIPEKYNPECTVKKGQNIRKIKKDVLEKAAKLFPSSIFINKNKNGRKETRVLFRPSPTVTS